MVRLGWRFVCYKKYLHPSLIKKEVPKRIPDDHYLFHGKRLRPGVTISDAGNKNKRIWKLNTQYKSYFSDVLNEDITMKVTMYCMRKIDRAGGFDSYVYHTPAVELDSKFGEDLKRRIAVELCKRRDKPVPPLVIHYHKPPTDEIWKERVQNWKKQRIADVFASAKTKMHQCIGINHYQLTNS